MYIHSPYKILWSYGKLMLQRIHHLSTWLFVYFLLPFLFSIFLPLPLFSYLSLSVCLSYFPPSCAIFIANIHQTNIGRVHVFHTLPPFTVQPCNEGALRLSAGLPETNNTGRVEMCIRNVWAGLCDERFDDRDAELVCSQLGLHSKSKCVCVCVCVCLCVCVCAHVCMCV